jgi:hypothetical protein
LAGAVAAVVAVAAAAASNRNGRQQGKHQNDRKPFFHFPFTPFILFIKALVGKWF